MIKMYKTSPPLFEAVGIIASFIKTLIKGEYILGIQVSRLEAEFARYVGRRFAVAVANGTDALAISLKAAGIKTGDEVITTPYSFIAAAEATEAIGAVPVFADIDPETFNLDVKSVTLKITPKTKAIIAVDIFGSACGTAELADLARERGLVFIEDACQAAGAISRGKKAGSFGDVSCFSFYPTKNLSCLGDGGMITTDDKQLYLTCRAMRSHGGGQNGLAALRLSADMDNTAKKNAASKYHHFIIGQNSRLDEIQAAVLIRRLKKLDRQIAKRNANARVYLKTIEDTGIAAQRVEDGDVHSYHIFLLRLPDRDRVAGILAQNGIETAIYYDTPLHLQPVFSHLGYTEGSLPEAERLSAQALALPVHPRLLHRQTAKTAKILRRALL